jgi:hypothetical protein
MNIDIKNKTGLFRIILVNLLLFLLLFSISHGQSQSKTYGIFIVTNSRQSNVHNTAQLMRTYSRKIRELNKDIIGKDDLSIFFCDYGNPLYAPYANIVLKVDKSSVPLIGLASLDDSFQFNGFVEGSVFKNVTIPHKACEQIMNDYKNLMSPSQKNRFTPNLFTGIEKLQLTPETAEIHINDVKTELSSSGRIQLEPGTYKIKASKETYRSTEREFTVAYGEVVNLNFILERMTGSIFLHSKPEGADIYIGGQHAGKTPLKLDAVVVGMHELRLKKDRHKDITTRIEVSENKVTEKNLTLKRIDILYTLDIDSKVFRKREMNKLTHKLEMMEFSVDRRKFEKEIIKNVFGQLDFLKKPGGSESAEVKISIEIIPQEEFEFKIKAEDAASGKLIQGINITTTRPYPGDSHQLTETAIKEVNMGKLKAFFERIKQYYDID